MAACPGQRAPTRARRHHGGLVTTRHLAAALSTARHLRSTRSPCSSRLHVLAASLSPRSCHTGAEFPFVFSLLSSSRRQPPSTLPCRAAVDQGVPLRLERQSSCATGASSTFQPKPAHRIIEAVASKGATEAAPSATKGLRNTSPSRSSSEIIYAVLSTARTLDVFPPQHPGTPSTPFPFGRPHIATERVLPVRTFLS
jgi:hypothetical protein